MSKRGGMGQYLLVAGYDLSGDIGSVNNVHGGPAALDVTGIDKAAPERVGGVLDGGLDYVAFLNKATARAHPVLSTLPTGDVHVLYGIGSTLGLAALGCIGKQPAYDPTRAQDGAMTFAVPHMANGYAVEWGNALTAGLRTDTAATNGTSVDGTAATVTGWSAYLQFTTLTGTDVTVKLQDSADNVSFSDVTGGAFTTVTASRQAQRIAGAAGATLRRYVRAVTPTSAGFTSATFAVAVCRHPVGATA